MIETEIVAKAIHEYMQQCQERNKPPTFQGVGNALNISNVTVRHIVRGCYKDGKPYTRKPHKLRCIDNMDFEVIKDIFINT